MSELKVGDKVWVLCEVVNRNQHSAWVEVGSRQGRVWVDASDCRPDEPSVAPDLSTVGVEVVSDLDSQVVKPPVVDPCTKTANDQLRQSLMDYPFGEPSNSPKIPNSSSDPINPSHYKQGGIECIEAIRAALGKGFLGYLRGNVIKYLWRYDKKNGVEDLKKARWYLDRLIKEVGE